jgi:pimeloyl-ACP methyl ester carboxylesterase
MEPIADATMERWFTPSYQGTAAFRKVFVSTPPEGYAACCDALRDWDFRGELGAVSVPTAVLVGADDPATPPEAAHLIADGIPGAEVTVIPNAAHLLNVEQAAAFDEAAMAHLTGEERP